MPGLDWPTHPNLGSGHWPARNAESIRDLGPALPMNDRARVVAIALAQAKADSDSFRGLKSPVGMESSARPGRRSVEPNKSFRTSKQGTVHIPEPRWAGPSRSDPRPGRFDQGRVDG